MFAEVELLASYGYVRVSSKDQNEIRQLESIKECGIKKCNIYIDKQSGKNFERKEYRRMLKKIKAGDVLFICSIDRLGRNYEQIQNQWRYLTKEKNIDIVVLDMPLLDTRYCKDLLGTFLSDMVLQLLSFVAENERNNIRQRQQEGITLALKRGVKFGRPPHPLPPRFDELYTKVKQGKISAKRAAEILDMPLSTFRYKVNNYEKKVAKK